LYAKEFRSHSQGLKAPLNTLKIHLKEPGLSHTEVPGAYIWFTWHMRNYRLQLSVLAMVLVGVLAMQYYWVSRTIQLQRNETTISLQSEVEYIVQYLEENFYCFRLYTTQPIPKGKRFYVSSPNYKSGAPDTLDMFLKSNETDSFIQRYSHLDFSVDAKVQIAFNFEYGEPSREVPIDSLTQSELNSLRLYERYLRINDIPVVDTVYLLEELAKLNEKQLEGIGIGVSLLGSNGEEELFRKVPKGFAGVEAFASLGRTLNAGSVFLQKVPFRFLLFDKRPFYSKINVWLVGVSVLLFLLLLLILFLFIRSVGQQRKTVELRNELLANITHEFNTPVTNISLAMKSLKPTDERGQRALRIIKEENERLKENIDVVLSAASLRHGIAQLDVQPISLHSSLAMVKDVVEVQLEACQGHLQLDLAAKGDQIMADEVHIINVLHNLIDNALKYCDERPRVLIKTYSEGRNVVLQVKDNGIGISKQDQTRIFEKFFRVSNQFRHEHKGFGFGLHYVQLVVAAHKGTISIQSEVGKGTTFTLKFPLKN